MPGKSAPPHHHKQIFDDPTQEDAALKKWDDDRWVGWFIKNLAGACAESDLAGGRLSWRPRPRGPSI
jgi:hypothetical protein